MHDRQACLSAYIRCSDGTVIVMTVNQLKCGGGLHVLASEDSSCVGMPYGFCTLPLPAV